MLPSQRASRVLKEEKAPEVQLGRVAHAPSESTAGWNARDPPDLLPKNPPHHPSLPSAAAPMGSPCLGCSRDAPASPGCWLLPPRAQCRLWQSKDLALTLAAIPGQCWHQTQGKILLYFGLFPLFISALVLISGLCIAALPALAGPSGFWGQCCEH